MALFKVPNAPVRDAVTGEFNAALVGQQVQIVARDTTTPFAIEDGAGDPIASSLLTVQSSFCTPTFWIDTATPADLYLDWYHAGSGARGPVDFDAALRDAAAASATSAEASSVAAQAANAAAGTSAVEVARLGAWIDLGVTTRNDAHDPRLTAATMSLEGATVVDTRPATGGPDGGSFFRRTITVANTTSPMSLMLTPSGLDAAEVVPGEPYTASTYARKSAGGPAFRHGVTWYDAAGAALGSIIPGTSFTPGTSWQRFSETWTVPAGAYRVRVSLSWTGTAVADQTLDLAMAQPEPGAAATEFHCGSTPNSARVVNRWTGDANDSPSERVDMSTIVRSVNGSAPDASGNVVVAGGGGGTGTSDHNALSNLTVGDPHTQYLNPARGDARYYLRAQVDAAVAAAATQTSAADRARGNHTGFQGIGTITGLQEALDAAAAQAAGPTILHHTIATANSTPRPAVPTTTPVVWFDARVDQSTPPTNMGQNDIWIGGAFVAGADLIAPTVPTGLTVGTITASTVALSWTASTDNVGVTGYEVRRDGSISLGVATGTTRTATGLTQNTAYTFEVRARDAAGNWSAWTAAAPATTAASSDTTAPTVPTGLASSGIAGSGFTVTWGAGTDNVGITGYDVRVNGGTPETVAADPRSKSFTGLAASTAYTVGIRSRDAAGNVSAYVNLVVTTGAAAAPTYSVYGTGAPTGSWTMGTDGTPYIVCGRGFYTFDSSEPTNGLPSGRVVGGRAWIPTSAGGTLPTEATFYLFGPDANIATTAVQTKVVSTAGATAGSWVEAMFDTPQDMGADGTVWIIAVRFTGAGDAGKYVFGTGTRPNSDRIESASGKNFAWAEASGALAALSSQYRISTGSVNQPGDQTQSYGIDVIVDAGA